MDKQSDARGVLAGLLPEGLDAASWYRALLQSHPDAVVILNPETARPVYFNDQAHRQLGYTREEFAGLSVHDINAVISPEGVQATIARVLQGDKADFDTVHRTKQGELRDIHVTAQLVHAGDVPLYHCIWRDITDRKRTEAALRVSEERLSRAQRSAGAGVWDWDIPTGRLVWSRELFELFGLDPTTADASFATWLDVLHPEDRAVAEQRIAESIQSARPLSSEYRIRRLDGDVRWIAALGNASYGPDGQPLKMAGICLDITDRKRAEAALVASNLQHRSLFQNMAEGLAYCRMVFENDVPVDFVYLAVNEAFSELTGLRDVVGKRVTEVIPGIRTTDAGLFDRYARVATSGSPERFEYHLDALDMWLELSVYSPARGEFVAVFDVINERKAAEAALRESQQKFQSIAEHVTDLIALVDTDGYVTYASPASQSMFAIGPEEMTGRHFTEFLHSSSIPTAMSVFRGAVAGREHAKRRELRMKRADGSTFIGELDGTAYAVGGRTGSLVTIRDVTDRRQADEQLEVLRYSVDQAPAPAYWLAPDGRFTYANDAGCLALGYTREELLQLTVFDVNPRAQERWTEAWQSLRERGIITVESEHRRKDGSVFPVEVTSLHFSYAGKEYCTGFALDVTEQRRASRERQALEAQLAEAQRLEAIGRLAGGVAHDFNNMLSVIMGHAEMALRGLNPANPLHENLLEIQTAAQRSAELTRQLLAFARRQTVAPKVLDLNDTVGGLVKMLGRLIGENVRLEWSPCADVWAVRMDPSQVSQLLTNLAANARDAITGVGTVAISTTNLRLEPGMPWRLPAREPGDYVLLSVRDDGKGMSRDVVEHVFEPFFTTKSVGEGTGLGLATVYGIVQQNGGFIDVTSEPGVGTIFTIGLPRWKDAVLEVEQVSPPSAPGNEVVLFVEDEAAILKMGSLMLRELGYRVLAAATPGEAIALADAHHGAIHLLIADVIMPEMNGRDLARRLLSRYPHIGRLFVSGYPADVIAHQGIVEEGVHFLQKPFTLATLSQKIREALDQA